MKGTRKAIGKSLRFEVFKRDSFKCQYCGNAAPTFILHVDHIKPVVKGGDNDITNLITSCVDCNLGKGARPISDKAVVERSRAQLEELQERREQLEMMMDWRTGLRDLKDESVTRGADYWQSITGFHLTESGQQRVRKLIKDFSLDEVLVAMDTSADTYVEYGSDGKAVHQSVERALKTLNGICRVAREEKTKPYIRDLYYARGILRKRIDYCDGVTALAWMEAAVSWGVTTAEIRRLVLEVNNWTNFRAALVDAIDRQKQLRPPVKGSNA